MALEKQGLHSSGKSEEIGSLRFAMRQLYDAPSEQRIFL